MKILPIAALCAVTAASAGYGFLKLEEFYNANVGSVAPTKEAIEYGKTIESEVNSHYVPRDIGNDVRTITSNRGTEITFMRRNVVCEKSSEDEGEGFCEYVAGVETDLTGLETHFSQSSLFCYKFHRDNWSIGCDAAREFNIF